MTDRVSILSVYLEAEYRTDDPNLEAVINAIKTLRGVSIVELGPITDPALHMLRAQKSKEIYKKIHSVIGRELLGLSIPEPKP